MRLAAKWRNRGGMGYQDIALGRVERIDLNADQTEVIRLGRGEPIVLVPGLAGGWRLVAPLARALARRHEVILYGLRGDQALFGGGTASIADYAADLAYLIDALRLERPTVLGVSFGGAVALELAAGPAAGRVGALVVSGAEARFRVGMGATIARRVLERYPLPNDSPFLNQFFNLLHAGRPEPGPLAEFVVDRIWDTDQGVMAGRLRALESFDVTDRLWRVDVPMLVLAGSRDAIVPATRQRALADAIAGARFESLEGAGHVGFLTHRADVARHVLRLVRERQRLFC